MKKLFTLWMALAATLSMSATTLFLKANDNWVSDNARFAVFANSSWFSMTAVPGETNIFSAVVGDLPDKATFYRMNPATTENTEANAWNKTSALDVPYGNNLYIMDAGTWADGGYWSKFQATPAAGSLYLWNGIGAASGAVQIGGESWVSKSDERVLIGAGQRGNCNLKINGNYDAGYYIGIELQNGVNAEDLIVLGDFRTDESKNCRLSIVFYKDVNASSPQATFTTTEDPQVLAAEGAPAQATFAVPAGVEDATYLRVCRTSGDASIWVAKLELIKKGAEPGPGPDPQPEPEDPTVQFAGELTSWSPVDFTLAADKKTATFTKNIAEGEHQFKIKLNGEWRSNAQTFDRDHASASGITGNESNNMKLVADVEGKYTFTWTFETNALEVVFPDKDPTPGPGPEPQDPTVTVIGSMTEWLAEIPFTLSEDKKTAVLQVEKLSPGNYEFKLKVNGEWRSNGYTFHREFTHADGITMNDDNNMLLQADVTGKYTFTWTFETNSIDIVFPAKDPDPQPVDKSGYYIVGNHTDWQIDADYKFEANPAQEGEYIAKMFLTPEYIIKVVYSEDGENIKTWFPEGEGNAYGEHGEITETGARTIYFRPNYDGGEDWFAGCLYVVLDQDQAIEDLNASEKAIKVIRNGQIIILKGDKAFNILGSQID